MLPDRRFTAVVTTQHDYGVALATASEKCGCVYRRLLGGGIVSSDDITHPAWIFTTQPGAVIAFDAFSGKITGKRD